MFVSTAENELPGQNSFHWMLLLSLLSAQQPAVHRGTWEESYGFKMLQAAGKKKDYAIDVLHAGTQRKSTWDETGSSFSLS